MTTISTTPTPVDRDAVVAAARRLIGVPWHHQGRSLRGVDCVGLLVLTARDLGYPITDVPSYPRLPEGDRLRLVLEAQLVRVDRAPRAGDIGLFHERRYPFHVCVFAERHAHLSMIHAFAKRRKVVEEVYAHDWPGKLMAVYALPGIELCS